MTEDLLTLIVQTAGQLSGQTVHMMFTSTPAMLGMLGSLLNPLFLLPYGIMVGAVPVLGTAIAVGLIK